MCSRTVQFILRHDRRGSFHFAPLAGPTGRQLLSAHGIGQDVDAVVLVEAGGATIRSEAILGVLRRLGGWWHLVRVFGLIPRPLRDALYDAVARRRHQIARQFGWGCYVPTPQERGRFLDQTG